MYMIQAPVFQLELQVYFMTGVSCYRPKKISKPKSVHFVVYFLRVELNKSTNSTFLCGIAMLFSHIHRSALNKKRLIQLVLQFLRILDRQHDAGSISQWVNLITTNPSCVKKKRKWRSLQSNFYISFASLCTCSRKGHWNHTKTNLSF